jgi:diguanylate cyclase (GGDEF)-like protein/putative nucleotidyltransferase with HDIG domain
LIAKGAIKGALNIYRLGEEASFSRAEFELAQMFGDAAALGLDNADVHAALEHQAQTDALTGLYNHRYFHERLHAELTRAARSGDSVALVMLDIDDFKRVNDVHGHGLGDDILRSLAEGLKSGLRASDSACRVGGEEFAVILPSSTAEEATAFANRFKEKPSCFDDAGDITVSVGVAEGPAHAGHAKVLVACAESAMMAAKARGKDRTVVYEQTGSERPDSPSVTRDARSIAHLNLLQTLARKLNRLNSVQELGPTIANELRTLIDYSTCRVYVREEEFLIPISLEGDLGVYGDDTNQRLRCAIGEGIAGTAAQSGVSLLIGNSLDCEFAVKIPGTPEIEESLVAVPLMHGQRCVGVVVMSKLGRDQFDADEVRLLEVLAGHASVALENARLYEAQKREAEHARALLEFSRKLAGAEGQADVAGLVAQLSAQLMGASKTSIWLQDSRSGSLCPIAFWGHDDEERATAALLDIDGDTAREFLLRPEPFMLQGRDVPSFEGLEGGADTQAWAVAPFSLDGGRRGCIVAGAPVPGDYLFRPREMELLAGLAHQVRLALGNARNFEDLEHTFLSTVESLANALEAKDESTSSHARSIKDMASSLGRRMGLEGKELKRLELGALFHDIGKIGIPTDVLLKPGRLTRLERDIVETHPEVGERILRPIERLQEVARIVRHCHEHYDGSGYPDGRIGQETPVEARIILVCDAFDAMTSDRAYRKRLSEAEACRRLQKGSGGQFDPEIVRLFLDVLQSEPTPAPDAVAS